MKRESCKTNRHQPANETSSFVQVSRTVLNSRSRSQILVLEAVRDRFESISNSCKSATFNFSPSTLLSSTLLLLVRRVSVALLGAESFEFGFENPALFVQSRLG